MDYMALCPKCFSQIRTHKRFTNHLNVAMLRYCIIFCQTPHRMPLNAEVWFGSFEDWCIIIYNYLLDKAFDNNDARSEHQGHTKKRLNGNFKWQHLGNFLENLRIFLKIHYQGSVFFWKEGDICKVTQVHLKKQTNLFLACPPGWETNSINIFSWG